MTEAACSAGTRMSSDSTSKQFSVLLSASTGLEETCSVLSFLAIACSAVAIACARRRSDRLTREGLG